MLQETTRVDLREQLAVLSLDSRLSVSAVARRYGVTRATVRKWRDRFIERGRSGLEDLSHAPRNCPHKTSLEIEELIVAEALSWGWGSKKLLRRLRDQDPEMLLPSRGAVDGILKRRGLVKPRRRRQRGRTPFARAFEAAAPADLYTIDFKGQFRLLNGQYCYPLTVIDRYSHYILGIEALDSTHLYNAWPAMVRIFREHGLPRAMLSDNGAPFGAPAGGRLSTMSVRLMQRDIQPVFIRPGRPQENGSHERMHRDLKARTTRPPEKNQRAQQKRFDRYRHEYNFERPHEALGLDRPNTHYQPSPRPWSDKVPDPDYPIHFETRRVSSHGTFKWKGVPVFISLALDGQVIGFEPTNSGLYNIYYYNFLIGTLDEQTGKVF